MEPRHCGAKLMAEGSPCSQERSEAGHAEQGVLRELASATDGASPGLVGLARDSKCHRMWSYETGE